MAPDMGPNGSKNRDVKESKGKTAMKKGYLFAIAALMGSTNLFASLDGHVHGTVELTLAQEENILHISLESPAANIVGFEHKAKYTGTNRDREALTGFPSPTTRQSTTRQ